MGVIWQKVWADFWSNKVRTALVVASIAVGVFSLGTIFGLSDLLLTNMDSAHRSVIPAHITMYLKAPIDRDTALALKGVEGVEAVEPLNEISVRYKLRPEDPWARADIVMRDNYPQQKMDTVQLKEGAWPKGPDLAVERLSGPWYHIGIGDQVIFEIDKRERSFPITGKIRHPFVPPPIFYDLAFFFADAEGMERFGIPQNQFSTVMIRISPYSADYAHEVASRVKDRLAKQDVGVSAVMYQDPDKHWGRSFMDGMVLVLQVLAVLSLFMSVILVANTLTALITQQTNQIGILKAIGGTTDEVVRLYLAGVLIYGLLALCISLPLGSLAAFQVSRTFLDWFNIDFDVFTVSRQALLLMVLASIGVPLLAALWPILRGAAITVRAAMASYGLGGDFGTSPFDRAVERLARRLLPPHYALALGNTFRRKGRLLLTQVVLVMAGGMFLVVMSLSSSITATLDADAARRDYDAALQFEQAQRIDRAEEVARSQPGVADVTMWVRQPATVLRQGQTTREAGLGSEIIGLPPENPMYHPLIVAGRWLQPGDDRVVVMGKKAADDNHIQVGDVVTLDLHELGKADWQVVGLYQVVFTSSQFGTDTLYAPRQAVFDATHKSGRGAQVFVRMTSHDAVSTQAIADDLEKTYGQYNMKVASFMTVAKERSLAEKQFSMIIDMMLMLATLVALVGGIGLMGSLSISVIERTKEIGVLRAIGGRSGVILRMFLLESMVQGLLSWLIAAPLAFLLARPMADALGQTMFSASLEYRYNAGAVLVWLAIVVVISALASLLPARSATRISVRQSLAYE